MKLPLCSDPNGNFSTSKFWTNIAYGVSTYIMIVNAKNISWELVLVYTAVVGGSEVAKKFMNMKYGANTAIKQQDDISKTIK